MMARTALILLFTCFGLFYVFFIQLIDSDVHMIFKLIPMLLLIILAITTPVKHSKRYKQLISVGLIFCAIGDYSLQWFIVGLSSFLVGHIFYILAFRTTHEGQISNPIKIFSLLYGLIMIVWIAGTLLGNGDIVLAIAVTAYISVILTMGWTSFRVGTPIAVAGAMMFIVSDTVLAINRFIVDVVYEHQIIMFTYYGAQLCLALSIAKYDELRHKMVQ